MYGWFYESHYFEGLTAQPCAHETCDIGCPAVCRYIARIIESWED